MKIVVIFFKICLIIFFISLGWIANDLSRDVFQGLQLQGLHIEGNLSREEVLEAVYDYEPLGNWICVNVRPERTYEDIVKTCVHEAAHELFARKCDSDPEVCFKVMEELEK
jgi:hypothetical protein